ncbi:hypothetical protein CEXT_475311 [Caerostris extrusa]|uniref:Uncharacterized protein n=1 Tax=Caerostris extrusa TaxID=172846 RepID=A0AAV4SQX5_CAEEX|nr:hypothetical protein CEXT_475311 [Caerostris extrusa]
MPTVEGYHKYNVYHQRKDVISAMTSNAVNTTRAVNTTSPMDTTREECHKYNRCHKYNGYHQSKDVISAMDTTSGRMPLVQWMPPVEGYH